MTAVQLTFDMAISAMATAALVACWKKGEIFAEWRSRLEAGGSVLATCQFCLAYWAGAVMCLSSMAPWLVEGAWGYVMKAPSCWLAVVFMAHLMYGLAYGDGGMPADPVKGMPPLENDNGNEADGYVLRGRFPGDEGGG